MATFVAVRSNDDPVEQTTILLGADVLANLEIFRNSVSQTLGFRLTLEQTIAHLLFREMDAIATVVPPLVYADGKNGDLISPETRARLVEDVTTMMRGRNKIPAIKKVREVTHMGLKEAKDWVEFIGPNY